MLDFFPTKKNVQIYPSKTIFFPNDRFSKKITTFTKDNFNNMNEGEALKLVELKNHKKFGKIVSPFMMRIPLSRSPNLSNNSTSMFCAPVFPNTTLATTTLLIQSSIAP